MRRNKALLSMAFLLTRCDGVPSEAKEEIENYNIGAVN